MQILGIVSKSKYIFDKITGGRFGMEVDYLIDGLGEVEVEFIAIFKNEGSVNWLRFMGGYF